MNTLCPHCGRLNELETGITAGTAPTPDKSASLCYSCGGWGIYINTITGKLALREPTPKELAELAKQPDAIEARKAWLEHVQGRPRSVRATPNELVSIARRRQL